MNTLLLWALAYISVAKLGIFRSDTVNLSVLGKNQAQAQKIYDKVGYQ